MHLPPDLAAEVERLAGAKPDVIARAIYDLDGNLGETYVVCTGPRLILFSKRLGQAFRSVDVPLSDIATMSIQDDGVYRRLTLCLGAREIAMKFSSWDQPLLERIVARWQDRQCSDVATPVHESVVDVAAAAILPPAESQSTSPPLEDEALSSLAGFCASMQAMMSVDGHVDRGESEVLVHAVPDPEAVQQGVRWLERYGVEKLLGRIGTVLTMEQKRCLMANLIAVAMTDGAIRGTEQELLDRFRTALNLADEDFGALYEGLLTRHRMAVFAEGEGSVFRQGAEELSPLVAFCAGLHAMANADSREDQVELECIARVLADEDILYQGRNYLEHHGVEHLLARLRQVLSEPQRRCLMANLFAMAMSDGLLRSREQELLGRFRMQLEIGDAEYERLYESLLTKDKLSVFAPIG